MMKNNSSIAVFQKSVVKIENGVRYFRKKGLLPAFARMMNRNIDYQKWQKYHEKKINVKAMADSLNRINEKPIVNILLYGDDDHLSRINESIESLRDQLYPYWRLMICDRDIEKEKLSVYSSDKRIGFYSDTVNNGFNSDEQCILFLKSGDRLSEDALYSFIQFLNEHPEINIVYSDEDAIDDDGNRSDPVFKPDWSPDTLLSCNYIGRSVMFRNFAKEEILINNDDDLYDLILKRTEKEKTVGHISRILLHKTKHSSDNCQKEKGKEILKKALERRQQPGEVFGVNYPNAYQIDYEVIGNPKVSIIMPMRDHAEDTKKCIASIIEKAGYDYWELIIADNGSKEAASEILFTQLQRRLKDRFKRLVLDIPFNFSVLNNRAAEVASGDYFILMNNDIELITDGWMRKMLGYAQQQHIGAVGGKLYFPDGTIQHGGVTLGIGQSAGHAFYGFPHDAKGYCGRLIMPVNYSVVTAALLMVSGKKFFEVNGLDEALQVAENDVDFCIKLIDRGYYNVFLPHVEAYHYECKTRGQDDSTQKRKRLNREEEMVTTRWKSYFENDPFYNSNLTRLREDYSLRYLE